MKFSCEQVMWARAVSTQVDASSLRAQRSHPEVKLWINASSLTLLAMTYWSVLCARLNKNRFRPRRSSQRGFMLLEVLVSILIFALGIVALVGLQGRSLMMTDDVQYRAEAIHLANAYMGQIWASGLTGTNLQNAFQTNGTRWGAFRDQVVGVAASGGDPAIPGIPGGQPPQVNVVNRTADVIPAGGGAAVTILGDDVTITISWLDRQDGTTMHSYVQTSSVGY